MGLEMYYLGEPFKMQGFGLKILSSICDGVFLSKWMKTRRKTHVRESFLIKLQSTPATLLKKKLWHRCFPAFVRTVNS